MIGKGNILLQLTQNQREITLRYILNGYVDS